MGGLGIVEDEDASWLQRNRGKTAVGGRNGNYQVRRSQVGQSRVLSRLA